MWMAWEDPAMLRRLAQELRTDPTRRITVQGRAGPVTATAEQLVGQLGSTQLGGSYFTFSDENNYEIWAFLKKCWERGMVYKGHDVMPWCPRCSTGISEHEIVTEGYQEITHPGVFLRFPLADRANRALLVWTTTPWTLTANVAAAVHPDLTYVKVEQNGQTLYVSKGALANAIRGHHRIVGEVKGRELAGRRYRGPFDELPPQRGVEHRVILWDEVSDAEGTGIVHIAPGCGAEDFQLGKEHGLAVIAPIDEFGRFLPELGWLPEFGLERELDWLRNMDDWMISKKRYYGLALPIYDCQACGRFEVIGSEDELKARAIEGWEQFEGHSPHRPWIDAVKIACAG